jgi:hypothetical protein
MFTPVENLPPQTIGFVAHGKVTEADREEVLEPTIEWALESGQVRLFYVIGADFSGYDRGGLFDEAVFGTRHFADFERIAFIADDGSFRRAVEAMAGLMPGAVRVFPVSDIAAARRWLSEPSEAGHATAQRNSRNGAWLPRRSASMLDKPLDHPAP